MEKKNFCFYGFLSLTLYIASFFFYAFYDEGINSGIYGATCFMNGLVFLVPVILLDIFNLSMKFLWIIIWLANPLYWLALYCYYRRRYNVGGNILLAAIVLGLLFLFVKDVHYGNVTTSSRVIGEKMLGYYLWLSSFFVLFIAMLKESLSLDCERKDITY